MGKTPRRLYRVPEQRDGAGGTLGRGSWPGNHGQGGWESLLLLCLAPHPAQLLSPKITPGLTSLSDRQRNGASPARAVVRAAQRPQTLLRTPMVSPHPFSRAARPGGPPFTFFSSLFCKKNPQKIPKLTNIPPHTHTTFIPRAEALSRLGGLRSRAPKRGVMMLLATQGKTRKKQKQKPTQQTNKK